MLCQRCGNQINNTFCESCGSYVQSQTIQKKKVKGCLISIAITGGIFFVGILLFVIVVISSSNTNTSVISKDEYKKSCKAYEYKEIARNPNDYKNNPAVLTGKVVQVLDSGRNVTLRVNVTKNNDTWENTVYVEYNRKNENESRILENDIITMYGNLGGMKNYDTIFGNSVSIPLIKAEYIDTIKN